MPLEEALEAARQELIADLVALRFDDAFRLLPTGLEDMLLLKAGTFRSPVEEQRGPWWRFWKGGQ